MSKITSFIKKYWGFLALILLFLWFCTPYLVCQATIFWGTISWRPSAETGQFGDQFGAINALFSALALFGIIYSILLQEEELKETRKEFIQQNFETTFFNLLKNQQEISKSINGKFLILKSNNYEYHEKEVRGLDFFLNSKLQLRKVINALEDPNFNQYNKEDYNSDNPPEPLHPDDEKKETVRIHQKATNEFTVSTYYILKPDWEKAKQSSAIELAKLAYDIFFIKYNHIYSHYFRNLYHILNFVYETEKKEIQGKNVQETKDSISKYYSYAQFVQAQMSTPELFLLYYNIMAFPKMKMLVKHYNILENLAREQLISSEHLVEDITLKSRRDTV